MLEESRKREIERGIAESFNRKAAQDMADFFRDMHNAPNGNRKEIYLKSVIRNSLLVKRVENPGFFKYVLRCVQGNKILMRHRSKLIELSLISIAAKEGISTNEISDTIDRRQIQRLRHEQYPSFFTDVGNTMGHKHKDDRESRFSTVYSPGFHSDKPYILDAVDYLNWDSIRLFTNKNIMDKSRLHACEILLLPEKWIDFKLFLSEFNDAIAKIKLSESLSNEVIEYFRKELRFRINVLDLFHNHFMSILADEWFKSLSNQEGKELLTREFSRRIVKKDVARTYQIASEIWSNKESTRSLLSYCAETLFSYGVFQDSMIVWESLIENSNPDVETLGVITENIGIIYRENNQPEMARQYIEDAIKLYHQSGNEYREMIGFKNLGEMELRLGKKRKGMDLFKKIEERAVALGDQIICQNIFWNLSVSARRLDLFNVEMKYLDLCKQYEPTNDLLLRISDRMLEINDKDFKMK